ncbi:hypothetical protein [Helicobacter anatolicus]|uniref:hypothetical protein n=1 Tax=Helicobacter anatolicus TaxID=2905874 RepID=UPI001E4BE4E8|nr:hypothetical protein [Helicobacter anatolicus]MCE3040031.1 hypothetical protein [Helicobacter anatolicus]
MLFKDLEINEILALKELGSSIVLLDILLKKAKPMDKDKKKYFISLSEFSLLLDICEKTLKNWLENLEGYGFLKHYRKCGKVIVELLSFRETREWKIKTQDKEKRNTQSRLYRNVALIFKTIAIGFKNYKLRLKNNANLLRKNLLEEQEWDFLSPIKYDKKYRIQELNSAMLEFGGDNEIVSFKYEDLTGRRLPKTTCKFYRGIIKKRVSDSILNYFEIKEKPNKGYFHANYF